MKKIAGVFLLALAVLVSFHPAGAQPAPKMPRIGFLSHVPLSKLSIRIKAFRQGLRDLGYVEGRSITIVYRSMEGPNDRLSKLAVDLVRQKVDVILAVAQPAPDAALKATRTIPIVVAVGANTVVANLNRPGGNGFRAIGAIQALDEDLRRPVLTANQVAFWHALCLAGVCAPVEGYGQIFTQELPGK